MIIVIAVYLSFCIILVLRVFSTLFDVAKAEPCSIFFYFHDFNVVDVAFFLCIQFKVVHHSCFRLNIRYPIDYG